MKNLSIEIAENDRNFAKSSDSETSEIMQNFWPKLTEIFREISVIPKFQCKPYFQYIKYRYSVTQSLSNSLLGDVVLDSFNKVNRAKDSILDQTYQMQICSDFYYDEF